MIRWFAGHPTAANLLLILMLAAGLFAAPNLTRETFPDYLPPEVSITIEYRGATAADVEEAICQRLGEALQQVEHMQEIRCTARENQAQTIASMEPGGDMGQFLDDIRTEIEALTDLPEEAEDPIIRELYRTDLVAAIAVTGPMSFVHLESYTRQLEDHLFAIEGVANVVPVGLSQRQWQVEISRDRLRQYGLGVQDIARAISSQNVDMPLGTLETHSQDIQLRFVDERRSLQTLASLPVLGSQPGAVLTLGDIATLSETYERREERVEFNGQQAIILEIHKNRDEDALRVMGALQAFITEETARRGGTVNLEITQDMTSIVKDRLQMLVGNGVTGLVLVGLVMALFFRPRLAFWALFGLPAAFAGAFVMMALAGLSLNMITLVALLMAIGIVMDDSVVVTENIARHASEGATPLQAAAQGTLEILPGVLSSFLTTVSVFLPLAFLAGELGSVLEVLPVVLIAALAASLIEAFWILPHHLKSGLGQGRDKPASRFRARFDRVFEASREKVGQLADTAIRFRYGVLAGVLIILLGSVGLMAGGHVRMEAMPEIDGDVLEARLLMPQGTPLHRTREITNRISAAMLRLNEEYTPQQPDGQALVRNVQTRFNQHAGAGEKGAHVATVMADLLTAENRTVDLATLTNRWYQEIGDIPGLIALNIQEPGFGPAGTPIEIRLQGSDLDQLKEAARFMGNAVAQYTGTFNVLEDLRPGKPQRTLKLKDSALPLGLTASDVARQIRTALLGDIVDTVQIDDQHIEILVRQNRAERSTRAFLEDTVIAGKTGQMIPLREVADITEERQWAQVTRIDGLRTVTVSADVNGRQTNADAIVTDLQNHAFPELRERWPELTLQVEGQTARSRETGQSIAQGLLIGLLGIFLILSFQFRSYLEPLIVMLSIPVAFMGAVWGHLIMGYNLSMPSIIGAASLAGIVVNNAILLVQFIKSYREQGRTTAEAAGDASRNRFRAIMITTSTTVAGLLPLLTETSTQAMAVIPLVISVVFGLLVSTVLVLVVLPALYTILEDLGWARNTTP
ncbi:MULTISPECIES: efflux RND transporter permease subunit [unclassified Marinobacter]|jgi:multidrug efflux pump subunit AcrB|uniref:efflux RND transporter permease subunit n=1 Tax=unclassified Marinobacter TaxID=83889 RepID=UPI001929718B|nr:MULTISPECIES: efflux RND transporter permease subunit [unclassified Marinobacter]MBL3825982.1 efflux RND transporter permease subunit [Marinobacter sp. MC3]MBL3894443.1 efflux RND transporter permease subunit [Marinobacter sp. MW3]